MRFALTLIALVLAPGAARAQVAGKCAQEWCPAHHKYEHCGVMKEHCIEGTVTGASLQDPTTWICKPSPASGLSESEVAAANDVYGKAVAELIITGKVSATTGVNLGSQIGTDIGTALGTSLRRSIEASNARAQAEQILAAQRVQEEAAAKEKQHRETVASLRPLSDATDETMSLRMGAAYDGNALAPDPAGVRASPSGETLALRTVDASETQRGGYVPPCADWKAGVKRLRADQKSANDAIARTKKTLESAKTGKRTADSAYAAARRDSALTILGEAEGEYSHVDAVLRRYVGRGAVDLHRRLDAVTENFDHLERLGDILREPTLHNRDAFGQYLQKVRDAVTSVDRLEAFGADPTTDATAEFLAGFVPLAEVSLDLGRSGIDMIEAFGAGKIAESEAKDARETLAILEARAASAQADADMLEGNTKLFCP